VSAYSAHADTKCILSPRKCDNEMMCEEGCSTQEAYRHVLAVQQPQPVALPLPHASC